MLYALDVTNDTDSEDKLAGCHRAPTLTHYQESTDSKITTEGNVAVFHMHVSGKAGALKPRKVGKLAGSNVYSYVWPTTMDPSVVGFDAKSGILAFAVTSHPDFDDTPCSRHHWAHGTRTGWF